jgi:anti-sigma B factor antagonist
MSAKISIRHAEDVTILDVTGRVTLGEGGVTLRDAVQHAIAANTRRLILNMGGVSYMDSSGVGELTGAYTSAKNKDCQLKLLHLTKRLDDLMQITKLATIFDIYSDEKEAIASFSN